MNISRTRPTSSDAAAPATCVCAEHASTHAASRPEDADAASGTEPTWEKSGGSGDVLLVVPLAATAHVQSAKRLQGSSLMRSLWVIDVLVKINSQDCNTISNFPIDHRPEVRFVIAITVLVP